MKPERLDMSDSALTQRDGSRVYPYRGQAVWAVPVEADAPGEDAAAVLAHVKAHILASVQRHSLCDPRTGNAWPQWTDADAFDRCRIPRETLTDLYHLVVHGELSDARPKGRTSGARGTTIRACSAGPTRSWRQGRHRRWSGWC